LVAEYGRKIDAFRAAPNQEHQVGINFRFTNRSGGRGGQVLTGIEFPPKLHGVLVRQEDHYVPDVSCQ
jgi:hypothetical protein